MTIIVGLPSTLSPLGEAIESSWALSPPSPLLAPKMNPQTNDFLSLTEGVDPVDAQAILALKVVRYSGPSVSNMGQRFKDIRKITASTVNDLKSQIQTAWNDLITRGDIRYVGTIVDYDEPENQSIQIRPQWVNLRALDNKVRSTTVTVNS